MCEMRPKAYTAMPTTGRRVLQRSAFPAEWRPAVSILPALLAGAAGACCLLLLLSLAVLSWWLVLLLTSASEAAAAPTALAPLSLTACPYMTYSCCEGLS